jgi:peptidoglycan hydrolase-like protein with peptidoglycan-binding domain/DNA invertase Pin-like site-specific DNA recombinase
MRRTYRVFGARAGLVAVGVMLGLLELPCTAIAREGTGERGDLFGKGSVLLARGAGYTDPQGSQKVRTLQGALLKLGWRPGPTDGLFGPRTTNAVVGLQRAAGLAPDGIVGSRTARALETALSSPLRRGVGYEEPAGSPRVRTLQGRLQRLGLKPGPVDGVFGPRTQAAVKRLQHAGDVSADGIVGASTKRLLVEGSSALDKEPVRSRSAPESSPDRADRGKQGTETRSDSGRDSRIRKPVNPEAGQATDTRDRGSGGLNILTLAVAVAALVLAGLMAMLLGRLGPTARGKPVPLGGRLIAKRKSRLRAIERFRGRVHALGRRGLSRRPKARNVFSDTNRPNPPSVRQGEVAKFVLVPPAQARPPAQAPPSAPVPEKPQADGVRALGYVSLPETEPMKGPRAKRQMEAIDSLCERRGWRLLEVVRDREEPRGTALDRPGLGYALKRVLRGEASCLIVSELRDLSRSVADLGRILDVIGRNGGRLVALDVGIDTSTPEGRKASNVLVTVSGWERQRLAERTRRGLEAARAKGGRSSRPSVDDVPALKQRIVELRERGWTLQAIADDLNAEGVPTLRGGAKWRPSSVQAAAGYRRPRGQPGAVARGVSTNEDSTNGEGAE